jgi:excisionase family DNA binding protein
MTDTKKELNITPLYLRVGEASTLLGVSDSTIWKLVREKKISKFKLSSKMALFNRDELLKFVESRKVIA